MGSNFVTLVDFGHASLAEAVQYQLISLCLDRLYLSLKIIVLVLLPGIKNSKLSLTANSTIQCCKQCINTPHFMIAFPVQLVSSRRLRVVKLGKALQVKGNVLIYGV